MHHQIEPAPHGGLQDRLVVGEEIVAPPSSFDAGPGREVESQVGIGKKEDADS